MKISELLEQLGELQGLHGDIEVITWKCDENGLAEFTDPTPGLEKPYGFEESVILL